MKTIVFIGIILLSACAVIDPGKVVTETKTIGFETVGMRVGSVVTKYETPNSIVVNTAPTKGTTKWYARIVLITILVLFIILILINL